jgi:hypothetical protein
MRTANGLGFAVSEKLDAAPESQDSMPVNAGGVIAFFKTGEWHGGTLGITF